MNPRTTATTLLLLVLAAVSIAATNAQAAAGSYVVSACSPTSSPGAWQQVNTSPASLTSGDQCGGPMIGPIGGGDTGALSAEDIVGSTSQMPTGSEAGWSFSAPAGTTITAVSYYRSITTGNAADGWVAGLIAQNGTALDTCQTNPDPCSSPNNQVAATVTGLNTTGLFFGVKCQPAAPETCTPGATQHYAQADMYSVRVTLAESGAPVVSGVGGPLWAGGVVSGAAPVTFGASDVSGISQFAVSSGSGQVALVPQSCDFSLTQPCPELPSGSVGIDTTTLKDGPQTLALLVTNAAGNTTSVQSPPVVVDNNGPPAPSSLTASAVGAGSDVVDLTWSDPVSPPQPVSGAFAQLCQATCAAPVAVSPGGAAQLTAPAAGTYTVRLWLVDTAGRGSAAMAATTATTIPPPVVVGPTGPSGPSGTSGPSGPTGGTGANMVTKHPAKLRIAHHLRGHRLTLTVTAPASVTGKITVALIARKANMTCKVTRLLKPHHGRASTTFTLTSRELKASKLLARASAAHASAVTVTVRKRA